jgi:hypothetical protein
MSTLLGLKRFRKKEKKRRIMIVDTPYLLG